MKTSIDTPQEQQMTKYKMLRVPEALHRRIKLMAVEKGKTISEVIEELVARTVEARRMEKTQEDQ